MEKFDLYKDIQSRTGGEIYAGIVESGTDWKVCICA